MKKIVALLGSPRKWGNTELLLEEFLKAFKDNKQYAVKKLAVNDLAIRPCTNCGYCMRKGVCVLKDDMTEVYSELKTADCLIIASPIYFTNISGQLKVLIDRCQIFWARMSVLKKPVTTKRRRYGVFLSVCGFPRTTMFRCAVTLINILFKILNVEFYGKITVPGVDSKGAVLKKEQALLRTRALAKKIIKEW
jgi:multimeric flavodoxin WrbA